MGFLVWNNDDKLEIRTGYGGKSNKTFVRIEKRSEKRMARSIYLFIFNNLTRNCFLIELTSI